MSSSKEGDKDASRKVKIPKRPELSNGGSLEDCISNVYQLLELPGIKWKCYRTKPSAPRGVPLTTDLVLKAYSKCILDGILCTWRRKQLTATGNSETLLLPVFKNDTPKELWVFWYDEEPPALKQHCEGLDVDEEVSSSSEMISYEVRTILFKALHVVMERDLTKDGYVRFGRWFTVPLETREHYLHYMYPTYSPAIRLNFFVHGANTVCASVQAQRQPTLLTLAKRHLEHKAPKTVIVGPWSMRGVLVQDQMSLLNDPKMQERIEKEWNHWKEYLQMEENEPEKVPDSERNCSPAPEATPQPAPHRSLLADSSDEEPTTSAEAAEEGVNAEIPARLRWMYEPECRIDKPKEETAAEKEKREQEREVRRKRRKDREDRRKEIEKKRAETVHPGEYDSDVVTDPELEKDERISNELPKMVLVEIDGVRMLYPSKFICVTLEDDRQVLEALGYRTHTVPEELQGAVVPGNSKMEVCNVVHGRRPRNRFVVNVCNPILASQAVYQKTQHGTSYLLDRTKVDLSANGYAMPAPPILRKLVRWKYSPRDIKCRLHWKCACCRFHRKRVKITGSYGLPAIESKSLYKDIVNKVRRKHDFDAYHKKKVVRRRRMPEKRRKRIKKKKRKQRLMIYRAKKGIKTKQKFIPSKKRQRRRAAREEAIQKKLEDREQKFLDEKQAKDELRATDVIRADSEDESYQMDKLCQQDWANFGEDEPTPVETEEGEKEMENVFNPIKITKPPHDENFKPEPFLPLSFINKKACVDFELKNGDDDMSEERFNEVYKDKNNLWKPGMSKDEKIELADYEVDPANQPKKPRLPYHLTEMPKKIKWDAKLPMPRNNKYFKGAICKNGLRGLKEIWAQQDKVKAARKKAYLHRHRKAYTKYKIRVAKWCAKKLGTQAGGRCLLKALNNLRKIVAKDNRSEGTKQFKLSMISRKKKFAEMKKELAKQRKPTMEDVMRKLDVKTFSYYLEKAGPQGVGMASGYIKPEYVASSPSYIDEESEPEPEDLKNGLGEGTSMQYQDGESVDVEMEPELEEEPIMETVEAIGHVRSAGEHVGPDGLLSPPASNEMPKGGPLSVGPPSIESQGLNQIYPTPPSVQMLQADIAQAHSPILHDKSRCMEDDIERIAVPGGGGTIVEIEADDLETENMKKWNDKTAKSKMSKFLASSCNDPILSARKRKYDTPMTEKFDITKKVDNPPVRMVYKPMVTRKFECAPPRHFAELVRSKLHEKRAITTTSSAQNHQTAHPGPMTPAFPSPAMPPHTPSHPLGPMGHHPMTGHGFPGTPGHFPPSTPTYPGMMARPGFVPGPGYPNPHQMMPPGYNGAMGQMGPRTPFMSPPNMMTPAQQQQMHMMRYQQMMHNRQMTGQGMPPGYGAPGMPHYPPGPGTPGPSGYGMQHQGASSVQQLNMFVNQSRFGANAPSHPGHPPPYGSGMQPMIPQSPSFNQPFGGNPMMTPMQQHQFHQQQMQQQMQMQHHQQQMQRNLQQQQHQHSQPQQMQQPTPHMRFMMLQRQWKLAINSLALRKRKKFSKRQVQLAHGRRPTSLQPLILRKLPIPPDPSIPLSKQPGPAYRPPDIQVREGDSLTIAILLSDTILDLHFDSIFDACPICSCSVSIRSRDLGMYITPHEVLRERSPSQMGVSHSNNREHTTGAWSGFHVNSATNCTCGFSAIRHRYLSCCTGLFAEDANEATTLDNAVATVVPPMEYPKRFTARNMNWFDSRSVHDMALLDQIRQMAYTNSLGKAVAQMATVREHRRNLSRAMEVSMDITVPSEYVISHVDRTELMMIGNSAITMSMKTPGTRNLEAPAQEFLSYFHPWGLQTANEIPELEGTEWIDLLGTVTSTIEGAVKQARSIPAETAFTVDGPMTWRQFVTKGKTITGRPPAEDEEDFSLAEPIPAVMRATAKEAIRAAPHIDQYYDQANLGPVDQPKDVMYITIIPDDDEIYESTVKFMDNLSKTYERMRLGHHVPFPVSTPTATRFRELYKQKSGEFKLPDQHAALLSLVKTEQMNASPVFQKETRWVDPRPAWWLKQAKLKMKDNNIVLSGPPEDCEQEYKGTHEELSVEARRFGQLEYFGREYYECPGYYEREGILRVGTPCEPSQLPLSQNVTSTAEFLNMTKHLKDDTGFVTRLKLYLQQMEDLVTTTLQENEAAFERHGYRYQLAVEARLKKEEYEKKKMEERMRYNAAKTLEDRRTADKPNEKDVKELKEAFPGIEIGNEPSSVYVDADAEERKRKNKLEEERFAPEEPQAPSPIPAGMANIPDTLSEQERATQPTLAELLSDPNSVFPPNAANISWKQKDTHVPNPFPSSNQPPVPFESLGSSETDAHSTLPHVIVIYMINPFNYGPEGHNALHMRIALLSFMRVFNSIMGKLPYNKRPQLQLEIVGMEGMDDVSKPMPDYFNDPKIPFDILHGRPNRKDKPTEATQASVARSLSVAVYTHPRVFFPEVYKTIGSARCMTAFGPGSQLINTINDLERMNNEAFQRMTQRSKNALSMMESAAAGFRHPGFLPHQQLEKMNCIAYKIPSTIVCLAPPPVVCQLDENKKPLLNPVEEQTLFVAYCLVGNDFLVATATDAQGKLIDNCIANIKPRRQKNETYRYKNKTQILDGMGKLWSFILGIMASDTKNWRLVVGRLGRIGHGEFRAWTHLLNKTSLLRYSGSLKDICGACRSLPSLVGTPSILSACLITLEPEAHIRIIPEFYDHDAAAKKNSMFQTPGDLSSTHILTFPVGAEINLEVQDTTVDLKAEADWEFGDLDIMEGLDDGDTEIMKDLGLETPSSAAIRPSGGSSMFFSEDSSSIEIQNQPLASGYYISTAPAPELPTWFWATCPSSKRHSPVHLKSSLHINISEVKNDDIAMESSKEKEKEKEKEEKDTHPLESRQTEEVLRHVLESYNALSWLNMNRQIGDRYSCLPIHIQHLLRLYHSVARLLA